VFLRAVVTGGIHCVTGGMPVSFLGLYKQFAAATSGPIEVIDRSRDKEKAFYLRLPVPC
jgi:hypothetical protein